MFLNVEFEENSAATAELSPLARWSIGLTLGALSLMLIAVLTSTPKAAPKLANLALEKLNISGVENPVTAVLLNFRSYDTLLEVAVLIIVAVAMLPITTEKTGTDRRTSSNTIATLDPVLAGLLRWLVPLALLVGGYLLWTGAFAPGGAFQAGAVIAGAGVAIILARRDKLPWHSLSARLALSVGLWIFIVVAAINGVITGTTLQYPAAFAGSLILFVEVAATISIATVLLLLFAQLNTIGSNPAGGNS